MYCVNGNYNSKCYKTKIGYRFVCDRPPCNSSINMSKLKLQTNQLIKQLETNKPANPPALYEGHSLRSSCTRNTNHFYKCRARNKTAGCGENSQIENYVTDYKYVLSDRYKDCLSRQANEGWRQTKPEELQQKNKVIVLNS